MSDTPPPPKPAMPTPSPVAAAPIPPPPAAAIKRPVDPPPPRPGRSPLAVLCALGFVVLVGGGVVLWMKLTDLAQAVDPMQVTVLQSQVRGLQQRLALLEQAPRPVAAAPVDLAPLDKRLAALEQRPASPPAADLAPLTERLAAVERRAPAPDIGPLTARLDALDTKVATSKAQDDSTIGQAGRIARLQVAGSLLEAGQPLGEIPGAPAALSRFALARPPTEAALRLAFPDAARAATEASQPDVSRQPVLDRMWTRMSRLVTVRAGDQVLVGAPATVVLADTRRRLDAGDLGGAVASLEKLDPPAAAAMADWRAQAQALLDARAALARMARG